jgi:hypothetical protein
MLHGGLWGKPNQLAAVGISKIDPVFINVTHRCQAEDLKPTTISKNGPIPGHKTMQAPKVPYLLASWPADQMKSVGQDDVSAYLAEIIASHPLYGTIGAYRHKGRSAHLTVRQAQDSSPSLTARIAENHIKG